MPPYLAHVSPRFSPTLTHTKLTTHCSFPLEAESGERLAEAESALNPALVGVFPYLHSQFFRGSERTAVRSATVLDTILLMICAAFPKIGVFLF